MFLRTLGSLELEGASFQRTKALLLLCFLALEGPQERHHLAELFWPGAVRGRTSLSTTLSRLRKYAPGSVDADALRVWTTLECDAGVLLAATERGDLAGATETYRGRFLEGFDSKDLGAELEEWVYGTREFLASRAQLAHVGLAEVRAAEGQFEVAARQADAAYRIAEGLHEPDTLLRLHTLMLAGGGQYTMRLRKEAEDFSLPLTQTQAEAREQLREQLGAAAGTATNNLPARGTSFVGREIELAEVAQLLSEHRQVTLLGPGGVGKSRLALHAAFQQLQEGRFPDGVYLVLMDALSSSAAIPASIASALSFEVDPLIPVPLSQRIIGRLGQRSILLVMDNFEHLVDGAPLITELLQACPNLKIVVTSRERLHIEEEWLYEVSGLAYPTDPSLTFEQSISFDAVRLFAQRARQANPDFALNERMLDGVIDIARLVEGLPLAIELSAVWVRAMIVSELAGELQRNLEILATPRRDVQDRHKTIQASFEHSWGLLIADERAVLRKLSVFRGGFRREAASEVAGATLPLLAGLVDKSLLRLSPTGRYDRHPLLFQFSQEKLSDHPEEKAVADEKHGEYHLQRMAEFDVTSFGPMMHFYDEELENARTAWNWAADHGRGDLLLGAYFMFGSPFLHGSRFQDGLDLFGRTIERLRQTLPNNQPALGVCLGSWAYLAAWSPGLVDPEETIEKAEEGLSLLGAPTKENMDSIGANRGAIVSSHIKAGRLAEARAYAEESRALAESLEVPFWVSSSWAEMGLSALALGDLAEAIRCMETSIAISKRIGADFFPVVMSGFLAQVYIELGQLDEAERLCEEGLPIARAMNHQRLQVILTLNLGEIALRREAYPDALAHYQEAFRVAKERDVLTFLEELSWGLGRTHLASGNNAEAQAFLREHLEASMQKKDDAKALKTLVALAEVQARLGQLEQAHQWLTFVKAHPATEPSDGDRARQLLEELMSGEPPSAREEPQVPGGSLDLDRVVGAILSDLPAPKVPW